MQLILLYHLMYCKGECPILFFSPQCAVLKSLSGSAVVSFGLFLALHDVAFFLRQMANFLFFL